MERDFKLNNGLIIKIESSPDSSITKTEAEMDYRAKEAVRSALNKAKVCKKPVAKYDMEKKRAYIETADGEREYV